MDGALRPLTTYAFEASLSSELAPKNNERPETLMSPGRPGSPPPELLTHEIKAAEAFCIWHFGAMIPRQSATLSSS